MAEVIVLDTDVLIDYFRGLSQAKSYIVGIPEARRATTDVTRMELFRGARSKRELLDVERFITSNFMQILPVCVSASRLAVDLVKRYTLAKGLTLPDALIAAITLSARGRLITGNKRDFEYLKGLDVETPAYRASSP
jgi:tRNA(fMet)-specific endonuclease VapC